MSFVKEPFTRFQDRCDRFQDRRDAGRRLASRLESFRDRSDLIVLALSPGGVPVGLEVAQSLGLPLDLFLVRELTVPGNSDLSMGVIASGGARVLNQNVVRPLRIPRELIDSVTEAEESQLRRMERIYRGNRPQVKVWGKTILLIDDGLAVATTMRAAIDVLRQAGPARILVAAPVGAMICCAELEEYAEEVICLQVPEPFHSVACWYEDFALPTEQQVRELLQQTSLTIVGPIAPLTLAQEPGRTGAGNDPQRGV